MQANWSLALNILLLMMVMMAIVRLMRARKRSLSRVIAEPSLDQKPSFFQDDIISVRKINTEESIESAIEEGNPPLFASEPEVNIEPEITVKNEQYKRPVLKERVQEPIDNDAQPALMMFLLAKENRLFAGYEMLQTILAAGLRFGEGQLFHRHQFANGQGPVLCSLAAATSSGVFDLQNIGAFSVRGLCLFMQASDNPNIDEERFTIMLDTARQLSEGLDAHLLDDKRRPLTEQRIARYFQMLNLHALS
jgi:cell division protein ZipA